MAAPPRVLPHTLAVTQTRPWSERVARALGRFPGGPWVLPRDQWIVLWRDGGVQRTFLFAALCALGVIVELLQFTLLSPEKLAWID